MMKEMLGNGELVASCWRAHFGELVELRSSLWIFSCLSHTNLQRSHAPIKCCEMLSSDNDRFAACLRFLRVELPYRVSNQRPLAQLSNTRHIELHMCPVEL